MRLGILGGAFNPPHIGHLLCAQEALARLELDNVWLIPFARAPHRELSDDPGAETRYAMCERAVSGDGRLRVSRIELERPGPSYTVDTLEELRERHPDDDLVLILGGDQAAMLPSWHEPERVLALAAVGVAERDDWPRERVIEAVSDLAPADRLQFFDMPRIDVSSTLVRERAAGGEPIRYLVPDAVSSYIGMNNLYGATSAVGADP